MEFVINLILHQARKVFGGRFVVTYAVIECAQREAVQRRRIRHQFKCTLAILNHFSNLETIPSAVFVTKDRVGTDVEIENSFDLSVFRSPADKPDNDSHPSP